MLVKVPKAEMFVLEISACVEVSDLEFFVLKQSACVGRRFCFYGVFSRVNKA